MRSNHIQENFALVFIDAKLHWFTHSMYMFCLRTQLRSLVTLLLFYTIKIQFNQRELTWYSLCTHLPIRQWAIFINVHLHKCPIQFLQNDAAVAVSLLMNSFSQSHPGEIKLFRKEQNKKEMEFNRKLFHIILTPSSLFMCNIFVLIYILIFMQSEMMLNKKCVQFFFFHLCSPFNLKYLHWDLTHTFAVQYAITQNNNNKKSETKNKHFTFCLQSLIAMQFGLRKNMHKQTGEYLIEHIVNKMLWRDIVYDRSTDSSFIFKFCCFALLRIENDVVAIYFSLIKL